ncbi:putative serine/threonine-protein kinase ndrA [Tritrichomonas foetus]|uniref:non-specific serine/threonine protein kinase n=1 Tax=Tritrichomonas foetus TaxID=1144522 RepID=A0A1J4KB62_9EUKA|nr:putative serine/threonine-protein kinase ndrA [Tritrichomonas foetus]|eukprot:OHT08144.1 putative serine/threonine-protein kinase ndrA [Tritrichomonas foetus]
MTIVRRPANLTHSCPSPGSGEFWDKLAAPSPSRQTLLKTESARIALESHFFKLQDEAVARKQRVQQFMESVSNKGFDTNTQKQLFKQFADEETQISRISRCRLKEDRFVKLKLIGRGGFGEIWLTQDNVTRELFAIKTLSKTDIILKDQIINVRTERDILSSSNNPWIVHLHASFQDDKKLYLVLEYIAGGDMMTALIRNKIFPEHTARFFAGEIALALHSIHRMNILHRDLKPDNILITESGHIKLTDFGLSSVYEKADTGLQKILDEIQEALLEQVHLKRLHTEARHNRRNAVGTCDYTAPEVLLGQQPTAASDYWSLGVIMFEMLFGYPPFTGKSQQETALRIAHFKKALRYPSRKDVSPQAVDLMKHLLCEKEQRYDFEQIISHPFFEFFNFEYPEMNQPPLIPVITKPSDTSHFDEVLNQNNNTADSIENEELAKCAFFGFTFKQRPQNSTLAKLVF